VQLEGHTDNTGDANSNKQLSLARANAVKDSLVSSGIDAGRVTTEGYGQEKPIASNDTETGKARNRRLELVVVKK
jgi:outer membrane protein OmpA-like peptidoglycan-associated protein